MAGTAMDVETAEQRLQSMDHSEQHYFNRLDLLPSSLHVVPLERQTDFSFRSYNHHG